MFEFKKKRNQSFYTRPIVEWEIAYYQILTACNFKLDKSSWFKVFFIYFFLSHMRNEFRKGKEQLLLETEVLQKLWFLQPEEAWRVKASHQVGRRFFKSTLSNALQTSIFPCRDKFIALCQKHKLKEEAKKVVL